MGRAALALPFLEAAGSRAAAQPAATGYAKNFIMITMPNGIDPATFWPTGGERDFVLSPVLQALERHRDKLLIVGPQFPDASSRVPVGGSGLVIKKNPGIHRAWTATTGHSIQARRFPQTGDGLNVKTNAPSVDQVIATRLKAARPAGTRGSLFDSLEFGVHPVGGDVPTIVNFTPTGAPMPRMQSDAQAWTRVFGGIKPAGGMGPDRGALRRAAVSTFLHDRFTALAPTLGRDDRQRLDSHLQSLREVEDRISATTPVGPGCMVTGKMPFVAAASDPKVPMADVPALYANMQDMVALAFACDLTRVASISFSHEGGGVMVPSWLGLSAEHHGLSHKLTNPVERDKFNKVMAWAAGMVARMLDRLKAHTHPEGGTLYDHTVVWWMFRHGDGKAHASFGIPAIIAGGAGGHFGKMGRYLNLPATNYFSMLFSLVNAMGIDIPGFGLAENLASTPLPGLRA
jgi:hypothetical protein